MIYRLLFLLIFSIVSLNAGTDGTIRGKVTDVDGAPLPGQIYMSQWLVQVLLQTWKGTISF